MGTNLTNATTYGRTSLRTTTTQINYPGAVPSVSSSNSSVIAVVNVVNRSGITTPGWNKKKTRPILSPVNPFTHSFVKTSREIGSVTRGYGGPGNYPIVSTTTIGCIGNETITDPVSVSASEISALDRIVVNKLLLRIKDQKVNLMQAYAERAATARTVGDSLTSLSKAYAAAKRGNFQKAASHLGIHPPDGFNKVGGRRNQTSLAKGWLALQYGWKPLISDIYGAAEAYWKVRLYRPPTERVVVSQKVTDSKVTKSNQTDCTVTSFYTSEYTLKYSCLFQSSDNQPLKTLAELGITNPAQILWELLPYSFVVDWFIPIGNFISSLDATLGVAFVQGSKTSFQRNKVVDVRDYKPYSLYTVGYGVGSASKESVSTARAKLSAFPTSQIPNFKDPYSLLHFENAVALFRTTFRK